MPKQDAESDKLDDDNAERGSLRDTVRVFHSHEDAREHEIARQAELSPYERMKHFIELQRRVWGDDNPDVRETGVVEVGTRDH
ncbi:MAG: hypothetical protein ACQEVA_04330 [Myxococcota bacterium]